jgi:uncharacterized membrane protein
VRGLCLQLVILPIVAFLMVPVTVAAESADEPAMKAVAEHGPSPTLAPMNTVTPFPSPTAVPSETVTPIPSRTAVPRPTTTPILPPAAAPTSSALDFGEEGIQWEGSQEPAPDPVGFAVAGVVLAGMGVSFFYGARRVSMARKRLFQFSRNPGTRAETWLIPLLAALGLGVAAYLAYVEINQAEAVCGPVGECNTVQGSAYAVMLGIPVAVWGVVNYSAVAMLWAGQRFLPSKWANLSAIGLLALTLFGTVFSIYLTYLELFVIGAICAWCLSSAVITTLLMLLVVVHVTGGPLPSTRSASAAS